MLLNALLGSLLRGFLDLIHKAVHIGGNFRVSLSHTVHDPLAGLCVGLLDVLAAVLIGLCDLLDGSRNTRNGFLRYRSKGVSQRFAGILIGLDRFLCNAIDVSCHGLVVLDNAVDGLLAGLGDGFGYLVIYLASAVLDRFGQGLRGCGYDA